MIVFFTSAQQGVVLLSFSLLLSCLFWVLKWHERDESFDYFVSTSCIKA